MKHEIFDKSVKIEDTDITFEEIYKKDYVPLENLDDIKKANLIIIPNENFRDEEYVWFPETTDQFFDYIKEYSDENVIADIAISDDNFKKMELHSAVIDVATVIVKSSVYSIVINIISSFLYDLVKKYRRNAQETSAKIKIITEETETRKCKVITYEGPASDVKQTLEQAAKDLFSED